MKDINRSEFVRKLIEQNPKITPKEVAQKWLEAGYEGNYAPKPGLVYRVRCQFKPSKRVAKVGSYEEIESTLDNLIYQAENVLGNTNLAKKLRSARREVAPFLVGG